MKNATWIIILAAIVLLCALASYFIFSGGGGKLAGVYVDGELIETIDMSRVTEEYEFTVADGGNVISVSREGIRVSEASCPDQTCVKHGFLRSGAPIVCLPHHLVIKWLDSDADFDARAG
jgi:hypothetical protein